MAAGAVTMYDFAAKYCLGANADLDTNTVKLALLTSSYTPDQVNHDTYADLTNELGTGFGYTSGGAALANKILTAITKGYKFSSDSVQWTAAGGSIPLWYYGVLYISGTINGVADPLLGYFLGDSTPANVPATTDGNNLTVTCHANGWFDLTRP